MHYSKITTLAVNQEAWLATGLALLLSFSCFFHGSVDNTALAISILVALILCVFARLNEHASAALSPLLKTAHIVAGALLLLLLLQWVFPFTGASADLWRIAKTELDSAPVSSGLIHDYHLWYSSLGRLLFQLIIIWLAFTVGSSAQACKWFLQTLIVSAVLLVSITFILTVNDRFHPDFAYHHGLINHNHTATYLGIMLLVSLWQLHHLFRRIRPQRRMGIPEWIDKLSILQIGQLLFTIFACALFTITWLMTYSRGGIAAGLVGILFFLTILFYKKQARATHRWRWLLALVIVIASLLIFFLFSSHGISLQSRITKDLLFTTDRPYIYLATLQMIGDYPLFGVGLGNFESVFSLYRHEGYAFGTEGMIQKAHNDYLELIAELGLVGCAIIGFGLSVVFRTLLLQLLKRRKHYGYPALGLSVMALVAAHSMVDFPLQIPGIAALSLAVILICTCQSELYHPKPRQRKPRKPSVTI